MFPLSAVLFPWATLPLHVFEPRYRELAADCLASDHQFGVVLIDRGSEVGGGDHRVGVGTVAHIVNSATFDDGRRLLLTRGCDRFRVVEWLDEDPYPVAAVDEIPDVAGTPALSTIEIRRAETAVRRCRGLLSELGTALPMPFEEGPDGGPEEQLWRLCQMAPCGALDSQRLLEIDDPRARASLLVDLVEATADDVERLLASGGG
jgi:Lon protease-like protein